MGILKLPKQTKLKRPEMTEKLIRLSIPGSILIKDMKKKRSKKKIKIPISIEGTTQSRSYKGGDYHGQRLIKKY